MRICSDCPIQEERKNEVCVQKGERREGKSGEATAEDGASKTEEDNRKKFSFQYGPDKESAR